MRATFRAMKWAFTLCIIAMAFLVMGQNAFADNHREADIQLSDPD